MNRMKETHSVDISYEPSIEDIYVTVITILSHTPETAEAARADIYKILSNSPHWAAIEADRARGEFPRRISGEEEEGEAGGEEGEAEEGEEEEEAEGEEAFVRGPKRHILIDFSNIRKKPISGSKSETVVPNVDLIIERLECGVGNAKRLSPISTRFVAGSIPPRGTILDAMTNYPWANFKRNKYTVQLTMKYAVKTIDSKGKPAIYHKERFVDELVHNVQQKILLDSMFALRELGESIEDNTLVLASGDGNSNKEAITNFPAIVDRMLDVGWKVEIWAWFGAVSGKYIELQTKYPAQLRIIPFEDHSDLFEGGSPAAGGSAAAAAGGAGVGGGGGAAAAAASSGYYPGKKRRRLSRRRTARKRGNVTRKHSTR